MLMVSIYDEDIYAQKSNYNPRHNILAFFNNFT